MEKYFERLKNVKDDQGGFSLLELVVAVGILLVLTVGGAVAYSGIVENARKTAVEVAAAEVYTGAVAYDSDGKDYKQAAVEWKNSTGSDSIEVKIGEKNSDGSFCVEAEMKDRGVKASKGKGAGCDSGGSTKPDTGGETGDGGEDDTGVIVPPSTAAECFDFDNGVITGYTVAGECGADVVVPNTIDGVAVVEIGKSAFYKKGLTSVVFNDGLETIGMSAFGSNELTSVEIPGSVKTIGNQGFAFNDLKSVKFNEGLETIGSGAFYYNSILSGHIDFPSSLKSIGSMAFYLTSVSSVRVSNNTVINDELNHAFEISKVEITRY